MPGLLLYAGDPASIIPPLAAPDLAGRFKLFDLIDWHPDGWPWGAEELNNPLLRIVVWSGALESQCSQLLGSTLLTIDASTHAPIEYEQPRAFYLDLLDPGIAAQLPDALLWWADTTRAAPVYTVSAALTLTISDVIKQRPSVPAP
jgi:hypothetical protein